MGIISCRIDRARVPERCGTGTRRAPVNPGFSGTAMISLTDRGLPARVAAGYRRPRTDAPAEKMSDTGSGSTVHTYVEGGYHKEQFRSNRERRRRPGLPVSRGSAPRMPVSLAGSPPIPGIPRMAPASIQGVERRWGGIVWSVRCSPPASPPVIERIAQPGTPRVLNR